MTAPLPPMPQLAVWTPDEVKIFAKLAVREALERVVIMLDESEGDIDLLRFKLKRMIEGLDK